MLTAQPPQQLPASSASATEEKKAEHSEIVPEAKTTPVTIQKYPALFPDRLKQVAHLIVDRENQFRLVFPAQSGSHTVVRTMQLNAARELQISPQQTIESDSKAKDECRKCFELPDGSLLISSRTNTKIVTKNCDNVLVDKTTHGSFIIYCGPLNDEEYLLIVYDEKLTYYYVMQKNGLEECLVNFIRRLFKPDPLDKRLYQINRDDFSASNLMITIPKDNYLVILRFNEITFWGILFVLDLSEKVNDQRQCKAIWYHGDDARDFQGRTSQRFCATLHAYRPGFFALLHDHGELSVWNLEEIIAHSRLKKKTKIIPQTKFLQTQRERDKPVSWALHDLFLHPDGRTLSCIRQSYFIAYPEIAVFDMEASPSDEKPFMLPLYSTPGFRASVTTSADLRSGRYHTACSVFRDKSDIENQTLHEMAELKFPLVERRRTEIPLILQERFPNELVAIMTTGYLGMFAKNNPTQKDEGAAQAKFPAKKALPTLGSA